MEQDSELLKNADLQELCFRTRKCFESYQNTHDKRYNFPSVYDRFHELCGTIQRNRTPGSLKNKAPQSPDGVPAKKVRV